MRATNDAAEEIPRSTLSKLKQVFKLYLKNWIDGPCGRDFYTAYDITKNRTNNHPEVYHSRQRLIYDKYRMPLGEWLIQFREMTNTEDNEVTVSFSNCFYIYLFIFYLQAIRMYLKEPPKIDNTTIEVDERIAKYKEMLDEKLANKEDLSEEEIQMIVKKYLGKIGGYLKCFDLLEEEAVEEEDEYLTAFEATDDEEDDGEAE